MAHWADVVLLYMQMEGHRFSSRTPPVVRPRSVSTVKYEEKKRKKKKEKELNSSVFSSSFLIRWPSTPRISPIVVDILEEVFFCCLTPHWPVATQAGLWVFSFSACRWKPKLHSLPMKTDLASRDHVFPFSSLVSGRVPCSAKLVFQPISFTCGVVGLPAPELLKGASWKVTSSRGPLCSVGQIPRGCCQPAPGKERRKRNQTHWWFCSISNYTRKSWNFKKQNYFKFYIYLQSCQLKCLQRVDTIIIC